MDSWLPTLMTDTPQAGFELAMHLSRLAVKFTQPRRGCSQEIARALRQQRRQFDDGF